jgi:predicted Zn-dependent protease with MMP-like domain
MNRKMTRKEFERLVEFALKSIPKRFRDSMHNIAVVVEDEPSAALLAEMEIEEGDSLYGLFQGTPLTERQWSDGSRMPDRISIYQHPIQEDAEDEEDMLVIVVETVIHEFGHYFGLSEEEIEAIEDEYWNADDDEIAAEEAEEAAEEEAARNAGREATSREADDGQAKRGGESDRKGGGGKGGR